MKDFWRWVGAIGFLGVVLLILISFALIGGKAFLVAFGFVLLFTSLFNILATNKFQRLWFQARFYWAGRKHE